MNGPFSVDKILFHPERIHEFLRTGTTFPVTWELDLTNKCNQNCPQCAGGVINQGRSNNDSLTREEAEAYIMQLISSGAKAITFTGGGEPLLAPPACAMLNYVHQNGVDVGLITNGVLLSHRLTSLYHLVKNCTWIRVSLDAGNPEVYKLTHGCGKGVFHRVVRGIRLLVKARKEYDTSCSIGTAFLTSAKTKKNMLEFTELSKDLGVDYAQFRPFHLDETSIDKELVQCQKLEDERFKVRASISKYQYFGQKRPYGVCYGHHFAGVINVHEVYLCCHFRGMPKYKLGDLRDNTLAEIWASDRRKKVYENIRFLDCVPACRCDPFNRRLWKLREETPQHVNFL